MHLASSKVIATAVLVALLSWTGFAAAQADRAITEEVLRDPWVQALGVLESLSGPIAGANADTRARLDGVLEPLEIAIGGFETQVDRVIDRLVGDPQFAYVAATTSRELAAQLTEVHSLFASLYATLGVQERGDVVSAQSALAELRDVLDAGASFERDVVQVLGSGIETTDRGTGDALVERRGAGDRGARSASRNSGRGPPGRLRSRRRVEPARDRSTASSSS